MAGGALNEILDRSSRDSLFSDPRVGWLWLVVRLYVGWRWIQAGWEKETGMGWVSASAGTSV